MPKNLIEQLEQQYLAQQMRDIVGNRLTLPLTVLHHLRDGKHIDQRLRERAIRDLQAIVVPTFLLLPPLNENVQAS